MFDSWFPEGWSTLEQLMWLRIVLTKNKKKPGDKKPGGEDDKKNEQQ